MISLTKLLTEVGRPMRVIKQGLNGRDDCMLIQFPGGEKEWFYFGSYYYAPTNGFSISTFDKQEMQEYIDLFNKYGFEYRLEMGGEEIRFSASQAIFEPSIKKYNPEEQARVDSGKYDGRVISEVKRINKQIPIKSGEYSGSTRKYYSIEADYLEYPIIMVDLPEDVAYYYVPYKYGDDAKEFFDSEGIEYEPWKTHSMGQPVVSIKVLRVYFKEINRELDEVRRVDANFDADLDLNKVIKLHLKIASFAENTIAHQANIAEEFKKIYTQFPSIRYGKKVGWFNAWIQFETLDIEELNKVYSELRKLKSKYNIE